MTTATLAPIIKTDFHYRITRSGLTPHKECWGAVTEDGTYSLVREESAGTPWLVVHKATREVVGLLGTLRACRAYIASGEADRELAQLQAHDRGEHAGEREPFCGRC